MANPNPSPSTRWGKGQSGNPGGKTSAHRKAEVKAAELAAMAQSELVEALYNAITNIKDDEDKLAKLSANVLRLLKDSQDRGFGAPQQHIDTTSGGESIPKGMAAFHAYIGDEDADD